MAHCLSLIHWRWNPLGSRLLGCLLRDHFGCCEEKIKRSALFDSLHEVHENCGDRESTTSACSRTKQDDRIQREHLNVKGHVVYMFIEFKLRTVSSKIFVISVIVWRNQKSTWARVFWITCPPGTTALHDSDFNACYIIISLLVEVVLSSVFARLLEFIIA